MRILRLVVNSVNQPLIVQGAIAFLGSWYIAIIPGEIELQGPKG